MLLLQLLQFGGRDPVDDGRPARPSGPCSTAVAPQWHFPGLAKQLHLFGAVHVDTKRPRQHPVAAVHMAFWARYASRRTHDLRSAWWDVMSASMSVSASVAATVLSAAIVAAETTFAVAEAAAVRVATAKPSEDNHQCDHVVSGTCVANPVISLFSVKPNTNNSTLQSR